LGQIATEPADGSITVCVNANSASREPSTGSTCVSGSGAGML
jgi:hypothetical protein